MSYLLTTRLVHSLRLSHSSVSINWLVARRFPLSQMPVHSDQDLGLGLLKLIADPGKSIVSTDPDLLDDRLATSFRLALWSRYRSTLTTTHTSGQRCCRNLINYLRNAPDCKLVGVILKTKPEGAGHIPVGSGKRLPIADCWLIATD